MYRVLIADAIPRLGVDVLRASPQICVDERVGMNSETLARTIGGYDALIVRSATKVTSQVIGAANRLRVIGRAGSGVDNIDVSAADRRGIVVMNAPGGNAVAVAEHAIALIASLARSIPQATASLKRGHWEKGRFRGKELCKQILGIVGLGQIGALVAERALGLRMHVIAFDPVVTRARAEQLRVDLVSLEELLARADVITLHVPRTAETEGMIGAEQFAQMKEGVLFVNTARGGLVDEDALLCAIECGKVAGAALDVFDREPPESHPLLSRDEVIGTPHLGGSTEQAQSMVGVAIAEQVRDFLQLGVIRNGVKPPAGDARVEMQAARGQCAAAALASLASEA